MNRRITELAIQPRPISLTDAELDFDADPIVRLPRPVPARGWVRYHEAPIRIEGRVTAWTSRAVQIEWETAAGATVHAWVWGPAVERLDRIRADFDAGRQLGVEQTPTFFINDEPVELTSFEQLEQQLINALEP